MYIHTIAYIQKACPYILLQTRFYTSHCMKFVLEDDITKHKNTI